VSCICGAVCCILLQCVAVCFSLVQCVVVFRPQWHVNWDLSHKISLRCKHIVAHEYLCCSVLQRVAACCSVLQRVAACFSVFHFSDCIGV